MEINQTYANDKSCGTLISTIATVLTEELASEVNGKKYLSVMIDGATDASGKENETVHCRYVKDGQPANRLIGHKAVAHGHAQGITWHVVAKVDGFFRAPSFLSSFRL